MLEDYPFPLAFVPALHMALNGNTCSFGVTMTRRKGEKCEVAAESPASKIPQRQDLLAAKHIACCAEAYNTKCMCGKTTQLRVCAFGQMRLAEKSLYGHFTMRMKKIPLLRSTETSHPPFCAKDKANEYTFETNYSFRT